MGADPETSQEGGKEEESAEDAKAKNLQKRQYGNIIGFFCFFFSMWLGYMGFYSWVFIWFLFGSDILCIVLLLCLLNIIV